MSHGGFYRNVHDIAAHASIVYIQHIREAHAPALFGKATVDLVCRHAKTQRTLPRFVMAHMALGTGPKRIMLTLSEPSTFTVVTQPS